MSRTIPISTHVNANVAITLSNEICNGVASVKSKKVEIGIRITDVIMTNNPIHIAQYLIDMIAKSTELFIWRKV